MEPDVSKEDCGPTEFEKAWDKLMEDTDTLEWIKSKSKEERKKIEEELDEMADRILYGKKPNA